MSQVMRQYGATPLIAAIDGGHGQVVQLLLEAGADCGELKTPVRWFLGVVLACDEEGG